MKKRTAFLLFETGMPVSAPGIAPGTSWSLFPAWGNYYFLDLLLASLENPKGNPFDLHFFLHERFHEDVIAALAFWGKDQRSSVLTIPESPEGFALWVKEAEYEKYVLMRTSFCALFDIDALNKLIAGRSMETARFSIGNRPLDFFMIGKKRLTALLNELPKEERENKPEDEFLLPDWTEPLFRKSLKSDAAGTADIPGKLLFSIGPMELFRENIRFIADLERPGFHEGFRLFEKRRSPGKEAHIAESGDVANSFVAAGSEILGKVRNSVIFQEVFVGPDAVITDAVVMNGNRIGKNAKITNSLILPSLKRRNQNTFNIGAGALIGGSGKDGKNRSFPRLIHDGVTVIGMNAEIPEGIRIEPASFIAPNLPKNRLMRYNKLERGSSIFDRD